MNEFEMMRKKAKKEREELASKRAALDRQIASLDKTIEGLNELCSPLPEEPAALFSVEKEMLKYAGLTDIVRMALQAVGAPLAPNDIVVLLKVISYPIERLDNPRAAITVILSRLVATGDVERKGDGENVRYNWVKKHANLKALPQSANFWDTFLSDVGIQEKAKASNTEPTRNPKRLYGAHKK